MREGKNEGDMNKVREGEENKYAICFPLLSNKLVL